MISLSFFPAEIPDALLVLASEFWKKPKMKKKFILALSIVAFGLSTGNSQGDIEWVRQHPIPLLIQLEDVEMDASGAGLAVGYKGIIIRTTDFGANWEVVETNFLHTCFEVALVPGSAGQEAWIGLSGSTRVAHTVDGGLSWQVIETGFSLSTAVYLAAPDENTAYIGTQNGILKTTDQGQNWEEVTPAPGQNWSCIFFIDANTGWASANNGAIFKTTDGGGNWTELSPGQFDVRTQLHFLDAENGYAAAFRSFYQTTDGGASWQLLSENAFSTNLNELEVADGAFMVGCVGNTSFASEDGGLSWERISPASYAYRDEGICALADGRAWIAGSHTMIAHTTDFGLSYTDQIPGNKNNIRFIDFVDMQHGWAAGQNGTILRTADGGNSWNDISRADGQQIGAGLAFSADEFWACAGNSLIRTTDGGQSWEPLGSVVSGLGTFTDMTEVAGKVFATNYNGQVYRTTDHGASWEALSTMHDDLLFSIHFPDPETGYAVGQDSTILKTTDGGDTWTRLAIPGNYNLEEVFFLDANRGWAALSGSVAQLLYTEDGGEHWEMMALPTSGIWRQICFSSPTKGYIVGGDVSNGRVLRTTDGGASWEVLYFTYGLLGALEEQEDETGVRIWIGGFGGNIELWEDIAVRTQEALEMAKLDISPNPVGNTLQIQLPQNLSAGAMLALYDSMGRLRLLRPASPLLNLEQLEKGWYVLRLESQEKVYQARVVVHR